MSVPQRCTCGAVLPADALFCHKCGKPQREDLIPVETPAPSPVAPPPPLPIAVGPPPISFHNGPAVRIALLAEMVTIFVSVIAVQLPLPRAIALVLLVLTGVLAVFLYRRRTGQRLSILNGAHLGWICGIFGFIIVTLMLTMFAVALSEPSAVATIREQLKTVGKSDADLDQMIRIFHDPANITGAVLETFLLFTILPAFGGAIGAKLLDRQ